MVTPLRKGKPSMKRLSVVLMAFIVLMTWPGASQAQEVSYARLARSYLNESMVAYVRIRDSKKLPKTIAPAAPGRSKFLVEAEVIRILKAPNAVNGRFLYLYEGPLDGKGKAPNFKKLELLVFLRPMNDLAVPFLLQTPDNQLPWSTDTESRLRAIAVEAQNPELRRIKLTGVQSAFTTDADDPYVHMTQFLFANRDGTVIGATMRVKPDGTGDVIHSSAEFLGNGERLQANTLMWYHFACTTPAQLPAEVLADQPTDAEQATVIKDYVTFKKALGVCN
jgi:hypothetical protein